MEYKHFSHPHSLTIYTTQPGEISCSGCGSPCSNSVYGCLQCWFCLDEQCFNAKRSLDHPSHSLHHLTLLPSPTYTNGSFHCNACSGTGSAFSFCCSKCEFDLHVHCALIPQTFRHGAHPHELSLYYGGSQPQGSCRICHQVLDARLWSYRCSPCNFYVHTSCVTNAAGRPRAPQAHAHAGNVILGAATSSAFQSDPLVDARVRLSQNQIARSMESMNMLAEIGTTNYKRKTTYNSWSSNSNPFDGIG